MPCRQQPTHISVTQRAWLTAPEKMHRCLHKVLRKSLLLLVQISMFASMMQTVILQMPAPEIFRGLANASDLADQEADQIDGCIHGLVGLDRTCPLPCFNLNNRCLPQRCVLPMYGEMKDRSPGESSQGGRNGHKAQHTVPRPCSQHTNRYRCYFEFASFGNYIEL